MDGEPNAADSRVERLLNLALRTIRNQTCQASRYHVIAPRGMEDSEQVGCETLRIRSVEADPGPFLTRFKSN